MGKNHRKPEDSNEKDEPKGNITDMEQAINIMNQAKYCPNNVYLANNITKNLTKESF